MPMLLDNSLVTTSLVDFVNDALFPVFRKFRDTDFYHYKAYYEARIKPFADLSPVNLLIWLNIDDTLEISRIDDSIVLRYENPFEALSRNYILLENPIKREHLDAIFAIEPNANGLTLREQPSQWYDDIRLDPTYSFTDNRDSFEYILSTKDQAFLEGHEFGKQRRRMGLFERTHGEESIDIQYVSHADENVKQLLLTLLGKWQLTANLDNQDGDNREFEALLYAIQTMDIMERNALIITIKSKPVAFAMFSIYGDTAIVGHLKVDYSVRNVLDYAVHILAGELLERGVDYMNIEQDLGLIGLREHKLHLNPTRMLEKLDIVRA